MLHAASTLRNLLVLSAAPLVTLQTAAPQDGAVAVTTVAGGGFPVASSIYGPFEDGFSSTSSADAATLTRLGCASDSVVNVPAGIDTFTAEQMIASQCNVALPRTENGAHVGLLDTCGANVAGADTGFVENLDCLYDDTDANSAHSTQVGTATDGAGTPVYGKWEDRSRLAIPALDACNGHFGTTPESPDTPVYHHHVAGLPPFIIGCFGPVPEANGPGRLVSTQACRDLYPECGDNDYVNIVTATGSRVYDPYCPCFSGFSNVIPEEVPPSPPSEAADPPPSPSPTVCTTCDSTCTDGCTGCTAGDLTGDFDGNGRATLGDAVHIANARLQYGSTGVNPIVCLEGDFDRDGSFTLNDAAHVAEAQFSKAFLPWEIAPSTRRELAAPTHSTVHLHMKKGKGDDEREVQVHISRPNDAAGVWKALSVQFGRDANAKIEKVEMPFGAGAITVQHEGAFFQAASLGGSGAAWPIGHAATVTFAKGTDMTKLAIDEASMNSYVVLQADAACKPKMGSPCATTLAKPIRAPATATLVEEADRKLHNPDHRM